MASRETERNRDSALLSEAAEVVMGLIRAEDPVSGDPEEDAVNRVAMARARLDACSVLPKLLERRSRLLGLDLADRAGDDGEDKPGSLAAVERRLEVVGKK